MTIMACRAIPDYVRTLGSHRISSIVVRRAQLRRFADGPGSFRVPPVTGAKQTLPSRPSPNRKTPSEQDLSSLTSSRQDTRPAGGQGLDSLPYTKEQEFRSRQASQANTIPETAGGNSSLNQPASQLDSLKTSRILDPISQAASQAKHSGTSDDTAANIRFSDLPDLTKGIPSAYEVNHSSSPLELRSDSGDGGLRETSTGLPTSGGGRGNRELPKTAYISSIERRKQRILRLVLLGLLAAAVGGTAYQGRNWEDDVEERKHPGAPSGWGLRLWFNRVRARLGATVDYYTEPAFPKLLPDPDPTIARPFTLVLGLEDLLIHSEWSREHGWRMAKRPGVDYFLRYLQQHYELVVFTNIPIAMADPIIRKLDPYRFIMWPLFREATKFMDGGQVKDLSYLNRDLSKVILVDCEASYARCQPENAIIIPQWTGDPKDRELVKLIPFLEYMATMGLTDTRAVLKSFEGKEIPTEFAKREAIARRKFEEELSKERSKRSHRLGKGLVDSVMGHRSGPDGLEQSAAEAFEQGKMLQDYIRERSQKQYEYLEKEIRENGDKWLKEMEVEEAKMAAEQMTDMKTSVADFFTGLFRVGKPRPEPKTGGPDTK